MKKGEIENRERVEKFKHSPNTFLLIFMANFLDLTTV